MMNGLLFEFTAESYMKKISAYGFIQLHDI